MKQANIQQFFHFTIGPVQGFVAQARRTRDFWAGSFILSWLSAVAMWAVEKQGGEVLFPKPDKDFMTALERGGKGPEQGTVPNRFKAEVSGDFDPAEVERTVRAVWAALAEHVWHADLAPTAGADTHAVWERQIPAFWDMQWALVDDETTTNTLDRMKNWRTHLAPDEPGVKCMMMDGWQELSGKAAPGRRPDDPNGPGRFWADLREIGSHGMRTDLRDGEMLCAMAFVKRRFARHFPSFRHAVPERGTLCGWRLPKGVPSVQYMAAAPWLAALIERANRDDRIDEALWDFHDLAYGLTGEYGEWNSNIRCVAAAIETKPGQKKWSALDGGVFFDSVLENARLWDDRRDQARDLLRDLKSLRNQAGLAPVSPFYAALLMDGDELGMHMSGGKKKQEAITNGLASFTGAVPRIVAEHSGFLVYAGGDDVLALLPLEYAMSCALALRAHYLSCFDPKLIPTTLSGAIEYAHVKMSLGKVLHDAHDLLDRVAKDGRGRDALACRIWKPGGRAIEWAMPWRCCAPDGAQVEAFSDLGPDAVVQASETRR